MHAIKDYELADDEVTYDVEQRVLHVSQPAHLAVRAEAMDDEDGFPSPHRYHVHEDAGPQPDDDAKREVPVVDADPGLDESWRLRRRQRPAQGSPRSVHGEATQLLVAGEAHELCDTISV